MTQFDKPLNQWIEEEVKVNAIRPVMRQEGDKIRTEYKSIETTQTQKSIYVESKERKIGCSKGHHDCFMEDRHKYIVGCNQCELHWKISPLHHDIKNGQIVFRDTGKLL